MEIESERTAQQGAFAYRRLRGSRKAPTFCLNEMKKQTYRDGTIIHAGDSAFYGGCPVKVVFVVENDEYTPDYPKEDWPSIKTGFMVVFENGARLHLDQPDDHFAKNKKESMG